MRSELRVRALARHPYVYVGGAFGIVFLATGVAALVASITTPINALVGAISIGMGTAVILSTAFVIGGSFEVGGDREWCTVTWRLGPWRRSRHFPRATVRSVRRYTSPRFSIMWPSIAGTQLRVDIQGGRSPIDLGGGFCLDELSLQAVENAIVTAP